ncbi:E1A-BINDING PROTEIN P400-LIKE [Salix viminalis]|uniref:E1A-BINDING PROTEIN P400-LIKE n=1 Tax=Salix viminalis TaxID=40686 RepID=A0A9Q0ZQY7_SALVM|nr:E1A-BINDING PROTEIN P400-LIKE [Salix viminalis]
MKQANEHQQEQQQQQSSLPVQLLPPPCLEQDEKRKSRRNPRIYPSNSTDISNYVNNFSYTPFAPPCHPPYPFSWPDTSLYHSSDNPPSVYSSSSSSSSFPSPFTASEEIPSVSNTCERMPPAAFDVTDSYGGAGLHQVMDDEEMAEIRSIGEQHQMEWNDTMNLVTSAWWFKFMRTMELDPEVKTEDDGCHPFEQVMEFPAWLNPNDQQYVNDHFPRDYFHDAALPCMDIGEIEGIEGEWLS